MGSQAAKMRQGMGGGNRGHRGSPGIQGQGLSGSTRMAKRTMSKPGHGMGRGKRRMKRA